MSQDAAPSPRRRTPLWFWFATVNVLVLMAGGFGAYYYFILRVPPAPRLAGPIVSATTLPPQQRSVGDIVKQVDRGVVLITVKNAKKERYGLGSGFLIDHSGLVATNYHVIGRAATATATFADGTEIEVKGCRAWDPDRDLAILELARVPEQAQVLQLCQHTDRPLGVDVIAIGHPQGFRFTATTGIISAVHSTEQLPGNYRESLNSPADNVWIQTSAAINGGNSGGPLLDFQGAVIGINTWIAKGQNLSFATDVRHLVDLQKSQLNEKAVTLAELTAPEQQVSALVQDFTNEYAYLVAAAAKSWTQSGAKHMIESKHPALTYLPKAMLLADKYRKVPAGYQAIEAACAFAACDDCPAKCDALFKPVAQRFLDDYLERPASVRCLFELAKSPLGEVRSFLQQASEKGATRRTKALASLALALQMEHQATVKKAESSEAIALIEKIRSTYGDVTWEDRQLSDALEPLLFSWKFLQVGRTPPDIVGTDVNGKELKLSEFRGKVVVLDFWVDWCPYCRELYPAERRLAKRAKDKPLVVIGVNGDDPTKLRQLTDDGTVTWRNWSDGPHGPIQEAWQVESFPTVYVLDEKGVIRYRGLRGSAIDEAVDELLGKMSHSVGAIAGKKAEGTGESNAEKTTSSDVKPSAAAKAADARELRQWTRRDGKVAKLQFVKIDGKKASFLTAGGKTFVLSLDDLSDADQQWIRDHAKVTKPTGLPEEIPE